jgi:phenylacetate-CoA ligase
MLRSALLLAEMRADQWKSEEELLEISERRLISLFDHAKRTVSFYRKRFALIATRPGSGSFLQSLASMPVTEKSDVRADVGSFISESFDKTRLLVEHTSGSTGVPLPLYTTPEESVYGGTAEIHHILGCGGSLFDRQAKITHLKTPQNLLQRLGVFHCDYLPVQADDGENLSRLAELKPEILTAYPTLLLPLARINKAKGLGVGFKRIFTGGETLSPEARAEISDSFGCPVHLRYGSMESSWMALECEFGSLHLQDGYVHVEITDDDGTPVKDREEGWVVVTPLWRRAMPFIRYNLGDRAAFGGRCGCGRGTRTLRLLRARDDDRITLPSGKRRSARSINLMDDISGILAYQIIQERPDLFRFRYVDGGGFGDAQRKKVVGRITDGCLGESVSVEFERVDSIERGRTGKIRTVISKVKTDGGG